MKQKVSWIRTELLLTHRWTLYERPLSYIIRRFSSNRPRWLPIFSLYFALCCGNIYVARLKRAGLVPITVGYIGRLPVGNRLLTERKDDNESRFTSWIPSGNGNLPLRQHFYSRIYDTRDKGRSLFKVPSVLHRTAEGSTCWRTYREVQQEVRSKELAGHCGTVIFVEKMTVSFYI